MSRTISWSIPSGVTLTGQKVQKRIKGTTTWDDTGFTPSNLMNGTVTSATVTLVPNRVYEFQKLDYCGTNVLYNTAGIREGIEFACIAPTITTTETSSTVSIPVTNTSITGARLSLKRLSDDVTMYGPVIMGAVSGTITATATNLSQFTQYYWQTELSATVSGQTVYSSSSAQLTSPCGAYNTSTMCGCPAGYTQNGQGQCIREETIPADISFSNYCLATSQNQYYSKEGSRIYNAPFDQQSIGLDYTSNDPSIYAKMQTGTQWSNTAQTTSTGPMNRAGVWIDTDCDGSKDSLATGSKTTIPYNLVNNSTTRTVYIGFGCDNLLRLEVNGVKIVDYREVVAQGDPGLYRGFNIWHIVPITINTGINRINAIAEGDGTVSDSVAFTIYDNSADSIRDALSDAELTIPFSTSSLRNLPYTVANCPSGWTLDNTNGAYTCKKNLSTPCGVTPGFTIDPQPTDKSAQSGGNAKFLSSATGGSGSTTYQWQRSTDSGVTWTNITGATSALLSLTNVQNSQNGYRYRQSATQGSTTLYSNSAILTVTGVSNLTVTPQPTNQSANQGSNATFTSGSTGGSGTTVYQWQVSTDSGSTWTNISGATSTTLTLSNLQSSQNGNVYRMVATNGSSTAYSNGATITVTSGIPFTISPQPSNQASNQGNAVTFTSGATGGTGTTTYQWQVSTNGGSSWNPVSGATSSTFTLYNIQIAQDQNRYRLSATQGSNTIYSNAALLTVAPAFNPQPDDGQYNEGENAQFYSAMSGGGTYQWQTGTGPDGSIVWTNSNHSSATTDHFQIPSVQQSQNNTAIRLRVILNGNTYYSNTVRLTVNASTYQYQFYTKTTNPYTGTTTEPNLSGAILLTSGTVGSTSQAITIPNTVNNYSSIDGKYIILVTDAAINDRNNYQNGASNGAMRPAVFRPISNYTSTTAKKAYTSLSEWGLNAGDPIIFTT